MAGNEDSAAHRFFGAVHGSLLLVILATCIGGLLPRPPESRSIAEEGTEFLVTSDDLRFCYIRWGEGNIPLIAVHGSPGDKHNFRDFAQELQQWSASPAKNGGLSEEIAVIAPDMIGYGASSLEAGDYGIEAQAKYLADFMDALGIESAHLLGYSWGGGIVLAFAHQHPERARSIVMLASMGIVDGEPTGSYWGERVRYLLSWPFVVVFPGAIVTALAPERAWMSAAHRQAFLRSFGDSDLRPVEGWLRSLKVPALILHGRHDRIIPGWVARRHAELAPTAELAWYDGGHLTPFHEAEMFLGDVLRFVARVERGQGSDRE